jgi:hypothetical protein
LTIQIYRKSLLDVAGTRLGATGMQRLQDAQQPGAVVPPDVQLELDRLQHQIENAATTVTDLHAAGISTTNALRAHIRSAKNPPNRIRVTLDSGASKNVGCKRVLQLFWGFSDQAVQDICIALAGWTGDKSSTTGRVTLPSVFHTDGASVSDGTMDWELTENEMGDPILSMCLLLKSPNWSMFWGFGDGSTDFGTPSLFFRHPRGTSMFADTPCFRIPIILEPSNILSIDMGASISAINAALEVDSEVPSLSPLLPGDDLPHVAQHTSDGGVESVNRATKVQHTCLSFHKTFNHKQPSLFQAIAASVTGVTPPIGCKSTNTDLCEGCRANRSSRKKKYRKPKQSPHDQACTATVRMSKEISSKPAQSFTLPPISIRAPTPRNPCDSISEGAPLEHPNLVQEGVALPVKQPHRETAILPSILSSEPGSDDTTTLLPGAAPAVHRPQPKPPLKITDHLRTPMERTVVDNINIQWGRPPRFFTVVSLWLMCIATGMAVFRTVARKIDNGTAFKVMASQLDIPAIAATGVKCIVFSDGCGSMTYVRDAAADLGIRHEYLPPYDPQTNPLESTFNELFSVANTYMWDNPHLPDSAFPYVLMGSLWVRNRMYTNRHGQAISPYTACNWGLADFARHVAPGTIGWCRKHASEKHHWPGTPTNPRHPPRHDSKLLKVASVGYLSMRSAIPRYILLDFVTKAGHAIYRASRHVYWNPVEPPEDLIPTLDPTVPKSITAPSSRLLPKLSPHHPTLIDILQPTPTVDSPTFSPSLHPLLPDIPNTLDLSDSDTDSEDPHFAIPAHSFVSPGQTTITIGADGLSPGDVRHRGSPIPIANVIRAIKYRKGKSNSDLSWVEMLTKDPEGACAALDKEIKGLGDTVCEWLSEDSPEYKLALNTGTKCRVILSRKRSGCLKARGVKQGFKEDKTADGEGFNYYAGTLSVETFRLILSLAQQLGTTALQGTRMIMVIDVSYAFLQSNRYPNGKYKYMYFRHPVTKAWMVAKQHGPIYGENSAPARWFATLKEFFLSVGFTKIHNENACYFHPGRNIIVGTHVDDCICSGLRLDLDWFLDLLTRRFTCHDPEWLLPNTPLDVLGMVLILTQISSVWYIYVSMERFIESSIESLGITDLTPRAVPIDSPVHCDCPDDTLAPCSQCHRRAVVGPQLKTWFQRCCGIINWCITTSRYDVALAFNRISAYMSAPTVAAVEAALYCMQYLYTHRHLCIRAPLYVDHAVEPAVEPWLIMSDSDQSGNRERPNKLCSTLSIIIQHYGMPIFYKSTKNFHARASPDIVGPHADRSSGAAEIFAAAEATRPALHLSYLCRELSIPFPKPFTILVDATTAEAFTNGTATRSKLRHFDLAQEWAITLRDNSIAIAAHISGVDNTSDMGTKIQGPQKFCPHRDRIYFFLDLRNLPPITGSPYDAFIVF